MAPLGRLSANANKRRQLVPKARPCCDEAGSKSSARTILLPLNPRHHSSFIQQTLLTTAVCQYVPDTTVGLGDISAGNEMDQVSVLRGLYSHGGIGGDSNGQELCCAYSLSRVRLFVTPWTVARQVPLSMGSPAKDTGVGCHALLQGIFPTQGSNCTRTHAL